MADISYVKQKSQKGLGDAIYCAKKHVGGEPFAVLLGDTITKGSTLCTKQLIDIYKKYDSPVISIKKLPKEKIERYGVINGEEIEKNIFKIKNLIEKPLYHQAPSNLAILGRYILTSDIFDKIEDTEPGIGGKIQLTDALSKLDSIYGTLFDGKTYDMKNRFEWLKASIDFAIEDNNTKIELLNFMKEFI